MQMICQEKNFKTVFFNSNHAEVLETIDGDNSTYNLAITEFQKSVDYSAGLTSCIASLGHGYAISGKKNEANRVLKELKELSKSQYVSSYDIAVIHTGLGEIDKAIIWLEKAFEQRDGYLGGFINIDPRLNILKSDKRFVELLKTIGFEK